MPIIEKAIYNIDCFCSFFVKTESHLLIIVKLQYTTLFLYFIILSISCNVISLYFVHWSPLRPSGLWSKESNIKHSCVGVTTKEIQYSNLVQCKAQTLCEPTPTIVSNTETSWPTLSVSSLKYFWVFIIASALLNVIPMATVDSETTIDDSN